MISGHMLEGCKKHPDHVLDNSLITDHRVDESVHPCLLELPAGHGQLGCHAVHACCCHWL